MTKKKSETRGRPKKITDQKLAEFKTYIIAGCTLKDACYQVGITTQTWRNFIKENPDYLAKFQAWKNELETRAKLNIARDIINKHDTSISVYFLDHKLKLKEKASQVQLNRARSKQIKTQTKIQEQQIANQNAIADKALAKMDSLTTDQLVALSHLADDEGSDVIGNNTELE